MNEWGKEGSSDNGVNFDVKKNKAVLRENDRRTTVSCQLTLGVVEIDTRVCQGFTFVFFRRPQDQ